MILCGIGHLVRKEIAIAPVHPAQFVLYGHSVCPSHAGFVASFGPDLDQIMSVVRRQPRPGCGGDI